MKQIFVIALFGGFCGSAYADSIPYFARKFNLTCTTCHVSPPKLNAFGEDFRHSGYRLIDRVPERTVPMAVWASARSEYTPDAPSGDMKSYVNRVEVISGGTLGSRRVSYFVEWRPVSFEALPDGTLRDRSGRFEDLFVSVDVDLVEIAIGQYRQIEQVDVSLRPGLGEPLALSASLPGFGDGTQRQRSLRGFSPAARSPSIKAIVMQPIGRRWAWTASAGVPFPGEFSLPLTSDARLNASNELELRPKGVVLESFVRSGLASYGGHVFFRDRDYFLANLVTTGAHRRMHWTVIAGLDQMPGQMRTRWSVEGQYVFSRFATAGGRLEERTADGLPAAVIPYANIHFPGSTYTLRLTIEQRIQRRRNATLVEVAAIF